MPAIITADERAMIDAKVAAGQVTRCPTGKSALTLDYVYVAGKGLVATDQEAGKRAFRNGMGSHFRSKKAEPSPAQIKRRHTVVAQMDAGQTREQIATMLGISPCTVSADVKAMGRTFPRPVALPKVTERVTKRRAAVSKMVAEGLTAPIIAKAVGVDPRTVWDDVKAMGLKMPRAKTQSGQERRASKRPKPEEVAARRDKVAAMIGEGMGGREIATKLGVPLHTVKHDARAKGVKLPIGRRTDDEWLHATLSAHKSTACRLVSVMRKAGVANDEIRETLLAIVKEAA